MSLGASSETWWMFGPWRKSYGPPGEPPTAPYSDELLGGPRDGERIIPPPDWGPVISVEYSQSGLTDTLMYRSHKLWPCWDAQPIRVFAHDSLSGEDAWRLYQERHRR